MSKPIRLFKLVTGELVLGKFDEEANMLEDVAIIQVVPTQQGVQMMMLPYGYPFEQEFKGSISGIDTTLYEAAVMDGANKRQQVWHITLPCLKSAANQAASVETVGT